MLVLLVVMMVVGVELVMVLVGAVLAVLVVVELMIARGHGRR